MWVRFPILINTHDRNNILLKGYCIAARMFNTFPVILTVTCEIYYSHFIGEQIKSQKDWGNCLKSQS